MASLINKLYFFEKWVGNGLYLNWLNSTTYNSGSWIFNEKTKKFSTEYGQEYTIRSDFDFLLGKLPNGEYSYSFNIVAANGINYLLDLKNFEVKNNNLVSK